MGLLRALAAALVLACGAGVVVATAPSSIGATAAAHPEPSDVDGDLIKNEVDNCMTVPNGAQVNTDLAINNNPDGLGDACDPDDDGDGVPDEGPPGPDNCRLVPNPGQEHVNNYPAGRGDACRPSDADGDNRFDDEDNCIGSGTLIRDFNPDQADLDGDDQGDTCDRDDDNDFFDDGYDNCPVVWNPTTSTAPPYVQADLDGDGVGSACDPDESILGPPGTPTTPGTPAATGPKDTKAPTVKLTIKRRQRLTVAGRALIVKATCSEACELDAVVAADAKAARRAGVGRKRVVLATGSWSLAGAGGTYVFARWKPAARKLRAGRKLMAVLSVKATDPAGNPHTATKTIELRK